MIKNNLLLIAFLIFSFSNAQKNASQFVFEHYLVNGNPEIGKTEIHIEVVNDTVWKYTTFGGKQIGDFIRLEKGNLKLYFHYAKNTVSYKTADQARDGDKYTVEEYPEDTKNILGYQCYRVKIRNDFKIQDSSFSTSYDMYVTKEIDLPWLSLIYITKEFSGFFPLEVTKVEGGWKETKEIYKVVSIK
jgi:hypothetical protein